MPNYRVTIRWGRPSRYHIEDLDAPGLSEVFERLPRAVPGEVLESGDLVEIRIHVDPEGRVFTPG
ncbi:MAG: hypothetical protein ACREL7_12410 [Longimicrobiales bacterium]